MEMVRNIRDNERGITGLETAIILIAFVMVASVFSYVVLSAGLFSSQKAKDAINQGLSESRGSLEMKGNVLAKMEAGVITEVYISVTSPSGGVDMTDTTGSNKVIVSFSDNYQQMPALDWTLNKVSKLNDDDILDKYEIFQMTISTADVNAAAPADQKLAPYHTFTLEIKPPNGPVLSIERTIPATSNTMVNLS